MSNRTLNVIENAKRINCDAADQAIGRLKSIVYSLRFCAPEVAPIHQQMAAETMNELSRAIGLLRIADQPRSGDGTAEDHARATFEGLRFLTDSVRVARMTKMVRDLLARIDELKAGTTT